MTWQEVLAHAGLPVPSRGRVDRIGFSPAERRALDKHWPREDAQMDTPKISAAAYDPHSSQVLAA